MPLTGTGVRRRRTLFLDWDHTGKEVGHHLRSSAASTPVVYFPSQRTLHLTQVTPKMNYIRDESELAKLGLAINPSNPTELVKIGDKPKTYKPVVDLPPLPPDQAEGLRDCIKTHGVLLPILLDEHGNIIDGLHRKTFADELGIPCPETMKPGLTEGEKRLLARCLNLARRHIDAKTKRLIIADQLRETPDKSDRWIGKMLGVDGKTVADVRRELESGAEIPHVAVKMGQDGKRYPNEKASTHHPHDDEPTNTTQVDKGSASTPLWLFDFCNRLAISICGKPFSVDLAADHWNKKCDHFFTEQDDALEQDWGDGPCWLNPPFTNEMISAFVQKAIQEKVQRGTTTIALLPHWCGYDYLDRCEEHGRIYRIKGPVIFTRQDGNTFPMNFGWTVTPLVVVVFSPHVQPGFGRPIRKDVETPDEAPDDNEDDGQSYYNQHSEVADDEPDAIRVHGHSRKPVIIPLVAEEKQRRQAAMELIQGDCLEKLIDVAEASVDVCLFSPPYPEIDRPYGRWTEAEWHDFMMQVFCRCRRILKPKGSIVTIIHPNKEKVGKMRLWPLEFTYWAATSYGPDWGLIQDHFFFNPSTLPHSGADRVGGLMRQSIGLSVWVGPSDCYRDQDNVLLDPAEEPAKRRTDIRVAKYPGGHQVKRANFAQTLEERGGVTPYNLLVVPTGAFADHHDHPAITPYKLAEWWCRYILPPGGVLCDPFCGSGTSLLAALDCGASKVIGIDLNAAYLETARRRILHESEPNAVVQLPRASRLLD